MGFTRVDLAGYLLDTKVLYEEEELRKRGYALTDFLGSGSYAKVKSAYSYELEQPVAIKIINTTKAPVDFINRFLPRELKILKCIRHPNCIETYDVFNCGGKIYIIMELANHGDLLNYISLRGALSDDKARRFYFQIIDAMIYLHRKRICHRDLKCENILLDSQDNVKLADFGFSRFYKRGENIETFCGSAAYASPEVLQGINYQPEPYDVWGSGIILYIMVCGNMPFDDSNVKKMIQDQMARRYYFPKNVIISKHCEALIRRTLEPSPTLRPTFTQIAIDRWLVPLAEFTAIEKPDMVPLSTDVLVKNFSLRRAFQGYNKG